MELLVNDLINAVERLANPNLAEKWDNVGLQIGSKSIPVKKVLLSLDVGEAVIEEAADVGANLIISHHPLIRQGLTEIVVDDAIGRKIFLSIKYGLSIYVAHTNLDKAVGGVNDQLAAALGLRDVETLLPEKNNLYKLVVFVPVSAIEDVKSAIGDTGGGLIGNYSHCSFETQGYGTFKPLSEAHPTVGEIGKIAKVEETRLESLISRDRLPLVLEAMLKAHPYEEVAYDLYPLENQDSSVGLGRIGVLKPSLSLTNFLELCGRVLDTGPRITGRTKSVSRVAVCGGGGADLIPLAKKSGADLLVTGDVKYHAAQLAAEIDFCVIDCGHDATEKIVLDPLKDYLLQETSGKVEIIVSRIPTSPWRQDV